MASHRPITHARLRRPCPSQSLPPPSTRAAPASSAVRRGRHTAAGRRGHRRGVAATRPHGGTVGGPTGRRACRHAAVGDASHPRAQQTARSLPAPPPAPPQPPPQNLSVLADLPPATGAPPAAAAAPLPPSVAAATSSSPPPLAALPRSERVTAAVPAVACAGGESSAAGTTQPRPPRLLQAAQGGPRGTRTPAGNRAGRACATPLIHPHHHNRSGPARIATRLPPL